MLNYDEFLLFEKVSSLDHTEEELQRTLKAIKSMGRAPILWRGMTGKRTVLSLVDNSSKNTHRAGNIGSDEVMDILGVKNQVFASPSKTITGLFGTTSIAVFDAKSSKFYQSSKHHDIGVVLTKELWHEEMSGGGTLRKQIGSRTKEELSDLAKEVAKTFKRINPEQIKGDNEVIVDTKEYWMLDGNFLISNSGKLWRNRSRYRREDDIRTYEDLEEIFYNYIQFWKWKQGKTAEKENSGKNNSKAIKDLMKKGATHVMLNSPYHHNVRNEWYEITSVEGDKIKGYPCIPGPNEFNRIHGVEEKEINTLIATKVAFGSIKKTQSI